MSRIRIAVLPAVLLFLLESLAGPAWAQGTRQKLGGTNAEARIEREVRHQLLLLPYYTVFDNLEYQVQGGTVVLRGQVTDPVLKSNAEKAVKGIEGVEAVKNEIEVLPPSPTDDRIRLAEYHAIFGQQQLFKYSLGAVPSIHIIVKGGHVTLVGMVDNQSDKDVAALRAKSVPGVFGVNDDLRVMKS